MKKNSRSTSYGEEYVTSCFTNKEEEEKGIFITGAGDHGRADWLGYRDEFV